LNSSRGPLPLLKGCGPSAFLDHTPAAANVSPAASPARFPGASGD
jgi:hypothetical protein